jgi:hypothetical protein
MGSRFMDRLGYIITINVCIEVDYHAEGMRHWKKKKKIFGSKIATGRIQRG